MEKYTKILSNAKLFQGISKNDILSMYHCFDAQIKHFKKGDYVFRQGEYIHNIYVVLDGCVLIQSDDYWGNRSILNEATVCEMFGESYAVHESSATLNDAVAATDCTVALFDIQKMMTMCSNTCRFHSLIIENLIVILTQKNKQLVQKLTHITKRTTREKLISYLSTQSKLNKSNCFSIPFNRQQLADFLSVDRSAMSNELCKMRNEGLIKFSKNQFTLL